MSTIKSARLRILTAEETAVQQSFSASAHKLADSSSQLSISIKNILAIMPAFKIALTALIG